MTTMKVITRAEERPRILSCVREARGNGECGFYYNENRDMYDMFNFREVVNEFKRFNIIKRRKGHRFNDDNIPPLHIHAIDHNNQTKIIDGKPVYIMVLQHEHSSINPIGFGLDKTFLVSGWIYCFFDEKIRDTLFKKFFLLEEPTPVIPEISIETKALEYFTQYYLDNTSQFVFEILNDSQDSSVEELVETIRGFIAKKVSSTILEISKCEELNDEILNKIYHVCRDKVMEAVDVLRENNIPKIKKNRKPKKCVACNSPALLKCGKCRRACYCGVECQRSDWLHHKEICEGCN